MKKFKIQIELTNGLKAELTVKAESEFAARQIIWDSFPGTTLEIVILESEEIPEDKT